MKHEYIDKNGKYIGPLTVDGDLNLSHTNITELPDNLKAMRKIIK